MRTQRPRDIDRCYLLCPHARQHFVVCHIVGQCFEASWPAYTQGEAFVHLFTIICCELFSKAGGRNPALWDKRPFVFNQSPVLNEKMFQMTRVKWKRGLGSHSAFRNQIKTSEPELCRRKLWKQQNFSQPCTKLGLIRLPWCRNLV